MTQIDKCYSIVLSINDKAKGGMKKLPDTIKKKIKSLMALNGDTQRDLAAKTGISYGTLSNKMSGKCQWSREDIAIIMNIYGLSLQEMNNVFFCD